MSMFETAEQWVWNVAVKKAIAGAVGFLASQQAIKGMEWLQSHGITLSIDPNKFETQMTVAGIAGFALVHDWLKLKFPESKWL